MKRIYTTNPAVVASNRALIGQAYRVVYRNRVDGTLRVMIGSLTYAEAQAVLAKWGWTPPGGEYRPAYTYSVVTFPAVKEAAAS